MNTIPFLLVYLATLDMNKRQVVKPPPILPPPVLENNNINNINNINETLFPIKPQVIPKFYRKKW